MTGILTVKICHIPDINHRCPEYGQFSLSIFWTSLFDVWNLASFHCPYSGHLILMFGVWLFFTVHIPDIKI